MDYPEEKRQVFAYHNGEKTIHCDPMVKYRKLLMLTRGRPNEIQTVALANVEDEPKEVAYAAYPELYKQAMDEWARKVLEKYDAAEKLEVMIRELFSMVPLDEATGAGATWENCLDVWDEFKDFLNVKKKRPGSGPTRSMPTAGQPTSDLPTQNGSASNSTSPASTCAQPAT